MSQSNDSHDPCEQSKEPVASTETLSAPEATKDQQIISHDFYFLPIPERVRYDPRRPPHFGLLLNIVFGIASTFTVANLYYCQPLLIQLSLSFGVSYNRVSRIPTLVQAGYASGLLLISPLGDLFRRRPLTIAIAFFATTISVGLPITNSVVVFEVLSFFVGMFTVTPQILMPLAADLAPPEKRASALSIVLGGLLFGILLARVLAGIIAEFTSYRVVYYLAIGMQSAVLVMLYIVLPDYPARNKGMTYWGILYSMAKFTVTEPLLIQAVLVNMAASACFTNFWVTLTFLLGGPPYHYSTLVIGLFGLVGMFGVAMAPLVGRVIDRLVPWLATVIAICGLICFQSIQVGAGGINIAAVIISCFGLDVFRQTQQVSLTSAVFGLDVNARARLNAVLIISIFIGQVMGTSVGTEVFLKFGWRPAAALSLGWTAFTLLVMLVRGPHCKRYTWFGYEGGFELRKSRVEEKMAAERNVEESGMTASPRKEEDEEKVKEPERAEERDGGDNLKMNIIDEELNIRERRKEDTDPAQVV